MSVVARIVLSTAYTVGRTKIVFAGPFFYLLVWMMYPVFNLLLIGLIYRENEALRDYAIIGGACMALLFAMLYNAGEILDSERRRGALSNLFLAPCSRYAWLGGFQLFAIVEALATAALTIAVGAMAFGLTVNVNLPALLLTFALFGACMWGFSMIVGAIGVAIRDANQISNLLFGPIMLLAGTMYPIALMPDWIRIPARFFPFAYGVQALVDSTTKGVGIAALWREWLPLGGFAILLPALGMLAFNRVERLVRRQGSLELT
jgi:ABC-2 type transport system permease protein